MSFNRIGVTALAAAACIGVALACGPNFPWQLLDSREETVSAPVELNFAFEVSRLVSAPKDSLRAVESDRPVDDEAVTAEREELQSRRVAGPHARCDRRVAHGPTRCGTPGGQR